MIARIVLAVSLAVLVAAPAPGLAGSVQIEIVEEPAPPTDDDAAAPPAPDRAGAHAPASPPPPSEEVAPPGRALGRVFRPPRASAG